MDPRLPGIILTVTGIMALVVTLTRGPNLGIPRRAGLIAAIVLLGLGVLMLGHSIAVPQQGHLFLVFGALRLAS